MLFHPTASGSILSIPEINQAPPLSQMIVVIERTHLVKSMSPQSSRGVRQASATKNVSMKRWQAWSKEVMKTVSEFLTEAI